VGKEKGFFIGVLEAGDLVEAGVYETEGLEGIRLTMGKRKDSSMVWWGLVE
jgi:hypothetical protein